MDNRYCCPCARAALSYAEKTVIELAEYAEKLELAVLAAAELYENHRLDPSYIWPGLWWRSSMGWTSQR